MGEGSPVFVLCLPDAQPCSREPLDACGGSPEVPGTLALLESEGSLPRLSSTTSLVLCVVLGSLTPCICTRQAFLSAPGKQGVRWGSRLWLPSVKVEMTWAVNSRRKGSCYSWVNTRGLRR